MALLLDQALKEGGGTRRKLPQMGRTSAFGAGLSGVCGPDQLHLPRARDPFPQLQAVEAARVCSRIGCRNLLSSGHMASIYALQNRGVRSTTRDQGKATSDIMTSNMTFYWTSVVFPCDGLRIPAPSSAQRRGADLCSLTRAFSGDGKALQTSLLQRASLAVGGTRPRDIRPLLGHLTGKQYVLGLI